MTNKIISNIDDYKNIYQFDETINYSDGYENERKIFDLIQNADPNDFDFLEQEIVNWQLEYHLSWKRLSILLPIKISKDDIVLEIGGGTGIITQYLCNNSKFVVTIEGSLPRAKIISKRCREHKNLQILVGNFLKGSIDDFLSGKNFDKILSIGVLEYANKFGGKNGDKLYLKKCSKFLNISGEFIIAIENKIGLKYLLGFDEDHLNIPNYGIQSFYKNKNDVKTYSKNELIDLLYSFNFKHTRFFYPFPDYKLPTVIISENYTESQELIEIASDLIYNINFRNYNKKNKSPQIHIGRVLKTFVLEKSLDIISNSFLIVARQANFSYPNDDVLFYTSKSRKFKFRKGIKFLKNNNTLNVTSIWKLAKVKLNGMIFNGAIKELSYINGKNLFVLLDDLFFKNDLEEYIFFIKKYCKYVEKTCKQLSTCNFELLPQNIIIDNSKSLKYFDCTEWSYSITLSYNTIIARFFFIEINHLKWLNEKLNLEYSGDFKIDFNNIAAILKIREISDSDIIIIKNIIESQKCIFNNLSYNNINAKSHFLIFKKIFGKVINKIIFCIKKIKITIDARS
jgi:2-polyprenyl-3-methyl-5-hydroxy-6-metoxy-1,4-benzoquinol methylase